MGESAVESKTELREDEPGSVDNVTERRYKLAQTVALFSLWVSMGFYDTLIGTTLPDLRDRLQVSTDQVSTARAVKHLGSLTGGLIAGVAGDRFHGKANLLLAMGLMLAGSVVIAHPWSHYVEVLATLYFLEGIAQGGMDAGNAFVLSLWGDKADPALHTIHFGYTFGMIFTPLMTAQFLSPDDEPVNCTAEWNMTTTTDCPMDYSTTTSSSSYFPEGSQIEIPYAIAGSVALLMGVVFIVFFLIGPPPGTRFFSPPKTSLKQVFSPASCAGGRSGLGAVMVALLVLLYVFINGQGQPNGTLGFTFTTESGLGFDKQEASLLNFVQTVVGMLSRLTAIVLSRWVKANIVAFVSLTGQGVALTLIATIGVNHKTAFWVFSVLNVFFQSPSWGAGYAFADKCIVLYAFVIALTSAGAGISGFAFTSLAGYMYEEVSKPSIYLLAMGLAWCCVINLILMQIVAIKLGYRHEVEPEETDQKDEEKTYNGYINSVSLELETQDTKF